MSSSQVKRCRVCGRISEPRAGRVEECGFCNSRLLEPVGQIGFAGENASSSAFVSGQASERSAIGVSTPAQRTSMMLYSTAALQLVSGLLFWTFDPSLQRIGAVVSLIAAVLAIIGGIRFLMLVHGAWKQLESFSPGVLYRNGYGSPGVIVGLLFVPLFNLFWMFVAFCGWSRMANRLMDQNLMSGNRANGAHALRLCISLLITPILGAIAMEALGPEGGLLVNWCFALVTIRFVQSMLGDMDRTLSVIRSCRPLSVSPGYQPVAQSRMVPAGL